MASALMWQRPVEESLEIGIREMALMIPRSPQKGTYMRSFWKKKYHENAWDQQTADLTISVTVWLCEGQQFPFNQQMQLDGCHWLIGFWMFVSAAGLRACRETGGGLGALMKFGVDALEPIAQTWARWKMMDILQARELGTQPPSSAKCL